MSRKLHDQSRLQTELAQLRAAVETLHALPADEAALRAAFRETRRQKAVVAGAVRGLREWRMPLAAAAVVLLAVGAVLGVVRLRVETPRPTPMPASALPMPAVASAFQPLQNSPGLAPFGSYSVVRVRIPLAALALVPGTEQGGTIEADLLVGEDGLARAIRFDPAGAMLVSAAEN